MSTLMEMDKQEFKLDPDCELRFEVKHKKEKVLLKLKSGFAEIFGTELVNKEDPYEFGYGAQIAVFTYHGCVVELTGKAVGVHVANETPMHAYLNAHLALEAMRDEANKKYLAEINGREEAKKKDDDAKKKEATEPSNVRGPIVMIVGPKNVGKSTLCRILLNYAVRSGRSPILVDLDVDQGQVTIPGNIGALTVQRFADVVEGFSKKGSLALHFGHKTPESNPALYNLQVSRLADICFDRMKEKKKDNISGIIINTCGWVPDEGHKLLVHAAGAFEVDAVLVLDKDRLRSDLKASLPSFVKVVLLPKSGGVVETSEAQRPEIRDQRIREYYYGIGKTVLSPHPMIIKWNQVTIYKIGMAIVPDSCVPLGTKPEENMTKLVTVTPEPNWLHHILSVSYAKSYDEVLYKNIASFLCVTEVDMVQQTLRVLSPTLGQLPGHILLLSEIQFMDNY
ncbi:GSCOCG00003707001-RA-CDS [Cotesia congregata]|uniref:Protein CLP1 homolog n=1 Tax=Cotesia congregata TaxID=51543 RepID=A0A8J2MZF2_COTCN|nr:GSCOCG00003707001-RA-CDS [Cotesia congregata]CAG5107414.1 Similar to cbc: Protein CLP1 homolog (Anopheles gambiae) [Cotesia congregata]